MKTTRRLLSAVLGGAAAVVLSCGDPSPVGVGFRGPAPQANLLDTLLQTVGTYARALVKCTPLPYDSVTKTIGPDGDTLQVGPHTLRVPPGALSAPVTITAVAPSDSVNRVDLQPEGLTFAQPASLVMSYLNCDVSGNGGEGPQTFAPPPPVPAPAQPGLTDAPPGPAHAQQVAAPTQPGSAPPAYGPPASPASPAPSHDPLRIAYVTDSLQIVHYLESTDDPPSQKVTGRLDHFSDYAIAW